MLQGMMWRLFGAGSSRSGEDAAEQAGEAGGGDDEPAPWVAVLTVFNWVQARLAVARLQDEGIPAQLRQEAVSTALPVSVGILGRIDVIVPGPMVEKALAILEAVEALEGDSEDDPPWLFDEHVDPDV